MIRGTTPTIEFTLPISTDLVEAAWITFAQNGSVVFNKQKSDCVCDGNKISVTLSQQETLQLTAGIMVEVQIRIRTTQGIACASDIISINTGRILKDGAI